ncbi:MAG: 3-keto-disaccharide hydrolase [Bacteroidota bacterium]
MKHLVIILSAVVLFLGSACQQQSEWEPVFNGEDLENWETYLGTPIDGHEDLAEEATPEQVFSVTQLEGENVIRISGEVNGSLATSKEFENYHLHMEFKWGDKVYGNRNSGLLYHSYGPFGAAIDTWMNSHEMQLMTGNVGDSYRMGDTYCEIPVRETEEENYKFDPEGEREAFGEDGVSKIAAKSSDYENPIGEWNEIDLYCYGRQSVHVVNGETVMVNYNSGRYENGEVNPLASGQVQIQSEGGELFVRNVKVRDIEEIPGEVLP